MNSQITPPVSPATPHSQTSPTSDSPVLDRVRQARASVSETRRSIAQSRESAKQLRIDATKTILEARLLRQKIRVLDRESRHRKENPMIEQSPDNAANGPPAKLPFEDDFNDSFSG